MKLNEKILMIESGNIIGLSWQDNIEIYTVVEKKNDEYVVKIEYTNGGNPSYIYMSLKEIELDIKVANSNKKTKDLLATEDKRKQDILDKEEKYLQQFLDQTSMNKGLAIKTLNKRFSYEHLNTLYKVIEYCIENNNAYVDEDDIFRFDPKRNTSLGWGSGNTKYDMGKTGIAYAKWYLQTVKRQEGKIMKLNKKELRILNEAFKAGSSLTVITKLVSVLEKRLKTSISLSDVNYDYSNSDGNFTSYIGFLGDGKEALRINFSLGKSDRVYSMDYFKDSSMIFDGGGTNIVFDVNDNIIQIVNVITDVVMEGLEDNGDLFESYKGFNKFMERQGRPNKSDDLLAQWIVDDPTNETLITSSRLSNLYKFEFKEWLKDQDESLSVAGFTQAVKRYLEENRLTNKFLYGARVQKGKGGDVQISSDQDEKLFLNGLKMTANERIEQLQSFIGLLISGMTKGILVSGRSGISKTTTVLETLSKAGIQPVYASGGGIKKKSDFYKTLWKHRDGKVIVLDDFELLKMVKLAKGMILAATDTNPSKPNSVTLIDDKLFISPAEWKALSPKMQAKRIPSTFEFNSTIIFITNTPLSKIPEEITGRILPVNLEMTSLEIMQKVKSDISNFPPTDANPEFKLNAFSFLLNVLDSIQEINFRTFEKITILASTNNPNWEKWAYAMGIVKAKQQS